MRASSGKVQAGALNISVWQKLVDEHKVLELFNRLVSHYWRLLARAIAVMRRNRGPSQYENFEYLAVRAALWQQRYPNGTYPARLPRMRDLNQRDGGR